ncbi:MAG: tetratricopeptide repeat protein [Myxococcota bacterium]
MKVTTEQYEALCRLGHTFYVRGKPARAARIFGGLTAIAPDRGYAWRLLGACRSRLGDAQGSASAFERALAVDSADAQARVAYAELLADHRRMADAISLLEPIVARARREDDTPVIRRARALQGRWRRH